MLPDNLSALTSLRTLRLKYNAFTTLPQVLGLCAGLEMLELSGNQIGSLDDDVLAGLKHLRF